MVRMHPQRGDIWLKLVTMHVFVFWNDVINGDSPRYSVQMADSVTVQEGLCVTIPCNFTANRTTTFTNSIGIWRDSAHNDVAYSSKSRKGTKSNFHVTGNPDDGDCTLTITNAGRENAGSYYFRFEESVTPPIKYSYSKKPVKVTVKDVINGDSPKYSVQMADNVTVPEGLCVTIPCNFTADSRTTFTNSTGIWRDFAHNDVAYSNKSRKGIKPNFHVTGNPDDGYCSLTITNAGREDDGFYHFWFEENVTPRAKYSDCTKLVKVTVTELKEELQIITHGKPIAGKETNLTCVPLGNYSGTPPTVELTKSDHNGTWKSSAFVTFTPTKSDHQTTVTCKMTFQAGKKNITSTKKLKLIVQYPPSITVTTIENKTVDRYVSGQKPVTLICRADSHPEADVTWYKENNIVLKNKSAAALHIDIPSHSIYVCSALNEVGMDLRQVEVFLQEFRCMDDKIIIGMVTGNIIILLLIALGVFFFIKRHAEKKKCGSESNTYELHGATGTESVYQGLKTQTDSIYHSVQSAQQ